MIFLEQIVKSCLLEEGQILLKFQDLGITWDDLDLLFRSTFEQAKNYINIYDWKEEYIGNQPIKVDYSHVKHLAYNAYNNMIRFMPDVPQELWEYNPYTKNLSSIVNSNFSVEYSKPATCGPIDYSLELFNIKANTKKRFTLPFMPTEELTIRPNGIADDIEATVTEVEYEEIPQTDYYGEQDRCVCSSSNTEKEPALEINGAGVTGSFDVNSLSGYLTFNKDYSGITLKLTSKYSAILELDMDCELFYTWFKSNLLMLIGSVKAQIDMSSSGLPFDFNADGLLDRAKELRSLLPALKETKQHWSNF